MPKHIGNHAAAQTGSVHDPAAGVFAVRGRDDIQAVFTADGGHLMIEVILDAVIGGILRDSHGIAERVQNTGARGEHRKLADSLRHDPVQLVLIDEDQILHTVDSALRHRAPQTFVILLRLADEHLAAAVEAEAELLSQLIHAVVALDAELRLERARIVSKAAVHNAGIASARLAHDVQVLFHHRDIKTIPGQFARNRAADHAAAHDDDIVLHHSSLLHSYFEVKSSHHFSKSIP